MCWAERADLQAHHPSTFAFWGDSDNDLRNAQLLVDNKADVNQRCRPEGMFKAIELMARVSSRCARRSSTLVHFLSNLSATPLGWCTMFGNDGLLTFLLRERADPEIRNSRGLRAIDIATSEPLGGRLGNGSCPIKYVFIQVAVHEYAALGRFNCVYIYVCMYMYVCVYIYIERERGSIKTIYTTQESPGDPS